MSKRLQVLVDDGDYQRLRRAAKRRGSTVSELVRQTLRALVREEPSGQAERKLAVIRAAAALDLGPSPDIEQMLAEIEHGYVEGLPE